MHRWRSRLARTASLVGVTACAGMAVATAAAQPAVAEAAVTTSPALLQGAWFWDTVEDQASVPVAGAPTAPEPSGVPDGDLAVAYTGAQDGSSSKTTLLAFDVSSIPAGATVTGFRLSLTLDSGNQQAANVGAAGAPIRACRPQRLWPAKSPGTVDDLPPIDCTGAVAGTWKGDTVTFAVPALAARWLSDVNTGVALVNGEGNSQPFQAVFTKKATAVATYQPAPPVSPTGTGAVGGSGGAGGSSAVGAVAVPAPAPAAAPAVSGGGADAVALPAPAVAPAAAGGATPQVAAPVAGGRVALAAHLRPAATLPGPGFWAAGAALCAVLLVASLVLGDPDVPAGVAVRRSRLETVLHDRRPSLG